MTADPFLVGEQGPWVIQGDFGNEPIVDAPSWGQRKIHPVHALAFVGGCAVAGVVVSLGLCALVGEVIARNAQRHLKAALTVTPRE